MPIDKDVGVNEDRHGHAIRPASAFGRRPTPSSRAALPGNAPSPRRPSWRGARRPPTTRRTRCTKEMSRRSNKCVRRHATIRPILPAALTTGSGQGHFTLRLRCRVGRLAEGTNPTWSIVRSAGWTSGYAFGSPDLQREMALGSVQREFGEPSPATPGRVQPFSISLTEPSSRPFWPITTSRVHRASPSRQSRS